MQLDNWDFVTIQQASIKSHDRQTYQPYASQIADIVHRYAPQAQLLVHQTWAYRIDDPRFHKTSGATNELTRQEEMYRELTDAYKAVTSELGAKRIPVGDAFYLADTDSRFSFSVDNAFEFATAKHPALPVQTHSLHVGWQWQKQKEKQTLRMDGHHANLAGEYLGACVWFEAIFGESVIGSTFIPKGLDVEHAKFLQLTAHRAIAESKDAPQRPTNPAVAASEDPQP